MTPEPTVPELLHGFARSAPKRAALVTWDGGERRVWSYHMLDETTDRIAAGLRAAGLRAGDRLCLYLDNGDAGSFYRLLHGAYKASVVPVPVNTRLAPREVAHIARDSGARRLVGTAAAVEPLADQDLGDCPVWTLEVLDELAACEDEPPPGPSHDDPADLLYTSGTTGLPKGAAFRHRALAVIAQNIAATLRLQADDVFQTPAPVYTSTGTHTCPLPVLDAGATLVLEPRFDIARSAATMAEEGTTVFFGVPAMLMLLLEKLPLGHALPRLRSLMYGGSPMPEQMIPRLLARFPGAGLWNLYGLTEAGPTGCVLPPEHATERPGSVGLPARGTVVKIVDASGNELGADETGEIVIRARSLMDGYHNMPDVSQNVLVDGWLHTGDIGRKDADGFLYLLDRKKDMIIRGGFNVYPAEIEMVLHDHPEILEAAVIGVPHRILGEEACAVVALRRGGAVGEAELEAFVAERLADFKRPRRWEFVEALPRSTMGKVLKRELRARYAEQPAEVAK